MSRKLTILHVLDHSLPHQDGYSSRSFQIMAAQRRKGWQPIALTSPKHEIECGDKGSIREAIEGLAHYRCGGIGRYPSGLFEMMLMAKTFRRLQSLVRKYRPDVIHAHSPVLNAIPAVICGKLFGIPVVYEIRAFWEDAGADQGTYAIGSLKYRLVRNIETHCCRSAGHVTVICRGLKDDLAKRGIEGKKISVIYNAIHPDDFSGVGPDQELQEQWGLDKRKIIGFIGSFYRYEGLDDLIRAFTKVAAVYPDAVLLLVGGGEAELELKRLADSLGLSERVRFPGRIALRRVPGVYAFADLMVYPRKSVRLTELVTPLKPLEAMAMGKPVIASNIGGHRELIQDGKNGILVASDDPNVLSKAILQLLKEKDVGRRLGANGRKAVEEFFNWDATTAPYSKIYEDLVGLTACWVHPNETQGR